LKTSKLVLERGYTGEYNATSGSWPVTTENEKVERITESIYGEANYWPLNFNDIPSGLVVLLVCLLNNNFHVIEKGFETSFSNEFSRVFTRLFFVFWYLVGVLLFMNLVTGYVVHEVVISAAEKKNLPTGNVTNLMR